MRSASRLVAFGLALAACGPSGPRTVSSLGDDLGEEGIGGEDEVDTSESGEDESGRESEDESEADEESSGEGGPMLDLAGSGEDFPPDRDPGCGAQLEGLPVMIMGETIAAGDHHQGSCATNPAPEREYWWVAPFAGSFAITTAGSDLDTVVYVREGGCEGRELACNDDTVTQFGTELWSTVTVELDAGQTISIFVDGYNGAGEFELGISEAS